MSDPLLYFLVALVTAFVATLPFGPINLTVVKTTVDHNRAHAMELSFAAAFVETGQALIAILFGLVINAFLADHADVHFVIAAVFLALAVFVFVHETHPSLNTSPDDDPSFVRRGVFVAMINPQAIPFWIFAVTAISRNLGFDYVGASLAAFLFGVFVGKSLALYGFVIGSDYLKTHMEESSRLINRLLAAVLLLIGLNQLWRAFSG